MVRRAIVRQTSNYKPAFCELQASIHETLEQRSVKDFFGGGLFRVMGHYANPQCDISRSGGDL